MCIQNNAKSMSGLELQGSETNVLESFDSFDSLKEELKKWNVSLEFDSFQKLRRLGNKIVISQTFNHDALLSKITSKENMNKDIEEVDGPYVVIDLENYTIETDFLGIQPLFYSQNKMKISEMPEEDMIQIEPQKKVIFGNEG
ncbi:MAG: hypothetical protein QXT63_07685, partial [Thermoplasmata archaeon]